MHSDLLLNSDHSLMMALVKSGEILEVAEKVGGSSDNYRGHYEMAWQSRVFGLLEITVLSGFTLN